MDKQIMEIIDINKEVSIKINDLEIKNIKSYEIKRDTNNKELVEVTLVFDVSPKIIIDKSNLAQELSK